MWIEAIEKHQHFDYNRKIFRVCKRHFSETAFFIQNNRTILRSDAIPTVFEHTEPENRVNDADCASNQCSQCSLLTAEIVKLNKQISDLTIRHDIGIQTLKRKTESLEDRSAQKRDQLNDVRKELSRERKKIVRLTEVISELKSQDLISAEDAKILNVWF